MVPTKLFIAMSSLALIVQSAFIMLAQLSDAVLVALIASIPGVLAAVVGLHNKKGIQGVQVNLDGRMSQLIAMLAEKDRIAERKDIAAGVDAVVEKK